MDFTISEELKSAQQLAQQILGDYTEVDKLKVIEKQEERFDAGLWQALADAGLLGLDIRENHGGTELGFLQPDHAVRGSGPHGGADSRDPGAGVRRRHPAALRQGCAERPVAGAASPAARR